MGSCYAICQEPDIAERAQCTAKCRGGLVMTGNCGSDCIAAWDKRYDDYINCQEAETQQQKDNEQEKAKTA